MQWPMKLWWPQAESMIAFAKAFAATMQPAHLERLQVVADWTYAHLVDHTRGEWFGYSDRAGMLGCFVAPRSIILLAVLAILSVHCCFCSPVQARSRIASRAAPTRDAFMYRERCSSSILLSRKPFRSSTLRFDCFYLCSLALIVIVCHEMYGVFIVFKVCIFTHYIDRV